MNGFLRQFVVFLSGLLVFPLAMFVIDPFDYFTHTWKIEFDRIHRIRQINVADWALSELEKIPVSEKASANIISLGDSRGRLLMSGGFEGGWKGRIVVLKQRLYDLSFGGAHLDESFSLLEQEIPHCPKVSRLIIVLPLDRLINPSYDRNRIKSSVFNSEFPAIRYLMQWDRLGYVITSKRAGKAEEVKDSKAWNVNADSIMAVFDEAREETLEANISLLNKSIRNPTGRPHLAATIVIPPYEPDFFDRLQASHRADIQRYLDALSSVPVPVHNLQGRYEDFKFVDPVHGIPISGHVTEMLSW